MDKFNLEKGRWVVANCGKFPSEKNCKLVIMAPIGQRIDLVEASVAHAVKNHGHKESSELRRQLDELLETVEI